MVKRPCSPTRSARKSICARCVRSNPLGGVGVQYVIWSAPDRESLDQVEDALKELGTHTRTWSFQEVAVVEGRDPSHIPFLVTFPGPERAPRQEIITSLGSMSRDINRMRQPGDGTGGPSVTRLPFTSPKESDRRARPGQARYSATLKNTPGSAAIFLLSVSGHGIPAIAAAKEYLRH